MSAPLVAFLICSSGLLAIFAVAYFAFRDAIGLIRRNETTRKPSDGYPFDTARTDRTGTDQT
jgi:hypothetical protein